MNIKREFAHLNQLPLHDHQTVALKAERSQRFFPSKDGHKDYPTFSVDDKLDIREFVSKLWILTGGKKGKKLSDPDVAESLIRISKHSVGTHSFKAPVALVETGPLRCKIEAIRKDLPLISELNTEKVRTLLFSGNAADLGIASFATATFLLNNKPSSIIESIEVGNEFCLQLIELGVTAETINQVRAAFKAKANQNTGQLPIDPLSKQFFFEADGEAILINPVCNDSFVAEMQSRIQSTSLRRFPRAYLKVGGMKPLNAGKVFSERQGSMGLLVANVPSNGQDPAKHLLVFLKKHGTVFSHKSVGRHELASFLSIVPMESEKLSNKLARNQMDRAYRKLALSIIETALPITEMIERNIDFSPGDHVFENTRDDLHAWLWNGHLDKSGTKIEFLNSHRITLAEHIIQSSLIGHRYPPWASCEKPPHIFERLRIALKELL